MDTNSEKAIAEITARVRQPPTLADALCWLQDVAFEGDRYQDRDFARVILAALLAPGSRPA